MVYNREEAARRAEAARTNDPYTCQLWTRTIFGAPSVGDFDKDGDSDAVDGWKHATKKHAGDRTPPRGVPVAWSGGSKGYGHRAVSLGNGKVRSTDAPSLAKVGTVDLNWFEKNWGLKYLGWSEDISGLLIPLPPKVAPPKKTSRGVYIDNAITELRKSTGSGERKVLINRALEALIALPLIK